MAKVKATKKKAAAPSGPFADWAGGARQVRDAFDSVLQANPSWNTGLRQLQEMNPGLAHGAEQLGSFFTQTPERSIQKPAVEPFSAFGGGSAPAKKPAKKPSKAVQQVADPTAGGAAGTPMSFADYLRMAQQIVGGGGTDYDALASQLKQNASDGDARLAAMYKAYGDSIAADAPSIQQNYDQGATAINSDAQQAQAQTQAAYQAARDSQTAQFAQLGIPEAAANLAAQGGAAASDQAHAVSNIAQNQQASSDQNAKYKTAAVNYNTGIQNASQLDAATQRAALQQQLASKLAEIESQRASDASSNGQQTFSDALQLMGVDNDSAKAQATAQQQDFENQIAAQKLALQQQGSGKTLNDALSQYNQLTKLASKAGIGNDPASFAAFLKNLQLAGKI
jgi:hypothetical protein